MLWLAHADTCTDAGISSRRRGLKPASKESRRRRPRARSCQGSWRLCEILPPPVVHHLHEEGSTGILFGLVVPFLECIACSVGSSTALLAGMLPGIDHGMEERAHNLQLERLRGYEYVYVFPCIAFGRVGTVFVHRFRAQLC